MLPREEHIHDRYDKQGKQCAKTHTPGNDPADLVASFSAGAGRECKWHGTQYHRPRRHQDWPQSQGGRLQHRISFVHALFAQLVCELDD